MDAKHMDTSLTVSFIDDCFPREPIAARLPELECVGLAPAERRAEVDALVTSVVSVGEPELAEYPRARMVLTCSTGTDHLDLEALRRREVLVCNTPTYCSEEVAEHALALVLGGWRGLWRLGEAVREGRWSSPGLGLRRRYDHSRLGIVGLGRIGRQLARRALALGVDVVAHDPYATPADGVRMLPLADLLRSSDAVSLHVPGEPGNTSGPPMIGAAELELMRPHAVLVNVSRAGLVDLDALTKSLRSGALEAAAFDVWPQEPPDMADPRLRTPGLLLTPHDAWSSPQADEAYRAEAAAALRAFLLEGREPEGIVR